MRQGRGESLWLLLSTFFSTCSINGRQSVNFVLVFSAFLFGSVLLCSIMLTCMDISGVSHSVVCFKV